MSAAEQVSEITVIGAGVVGLATAAALAARGKTPLVLERESGPGRGLTSRNSGVIHAGLYYPHNTLKSKTCILGNRLLYRFCQAHGVAHRRLGKLVVARDQHQLTALQTLFSQASSVGVEDLEVLERKQLAQRAPHIAGVAALWSPHSGIVDPHELTKALEATLRVNGGEVLYRATVVHVAPDQGGYRLTIRRDRGADETLWTQQLINAAGLAADRIAQQLGIESYRHHFCRGDYFAINGPQAKLVDQLVYPLPDQDLKGLGVHLTPDLGGRLRIGPDATFVDRTDGDVDPQKAEAFFESARRLLPALDRRSLSPDTFGIRPKLSRDSFCDFIIAEESKRGLPGLINLVGIESPGLTAALAIGEEVGRLIH